MSAAFKLAKKKHSQQELRKLMNDQKSKLQQTTKKIDSPLAKYNDAGQLMCILCKSIVRSEDVWKVHINAKQHKENIILAKKLKEKTHNFTVPAKRPAPPTPEIVSVVPSKKIKSILKNSSTINHKTEIPADFFDSKTKSSIKKELISIKKSENESMEVDLVNGDEIVPEGFFDDPIQDAKVRNLEYKDPVEEEWEKFQKEMREEKTVSNAIMAEDQEESTTERQIDEIDEQIRNWTRVLDLEKKKEKTIISEKLKSKQMEVEEESSDEEVDESFDEFLDWRVKKSHK